MQILCGSAIFVIRECVCWLENNFMELAVSYNFTMIHSLGLQEVTTSLFLVREVGTCQVEIRLQAMLGRGMQLKGRLQRRISHILNKIV